MAKAISRKSTTKKSSNLHAVISPRNPASVGSKKTLNYKAKSVIVSDSSRIQEENLKGRAGEKNHSTLGARIAISLIAVLVLILLAIFVQQSFSGKAIETPQAEIVSFDSMASEQVLISGFDVTPFEFMVTPSKAEGARVDPVAVKLRLTMKMDDHDLLHYTLDDITSVRSVLLSQGLLGSDVPSMDGIYVNDDDVADLAFLLEGPYVRIFNLNYVTPEAASIELVTVGAADGSGAERIIPNARIIDVAAGGKVATLFHVNSTIVPEVAFVWQNGSDVVEAVKLSETENSSLWALNWTPAVARGSVPFTVKAQVDQEYSERQFVMAVGGVDYTLLNNDGSVRLEMYRENGAPWVHYQLAASNGLLPLLAACDGFPALSTLADKIETVYTYNAGVQQWRAGVPSEFGQLRVGDGYLVKLKEGASLDVKYACSDNAMPPAEMMLKPGWNLVSFGGSVVRDVDALVPPVGTQIRLVFEVTTGAMIPDAPLESLDPGRVYWIKVQ